VTAPHLEEAFLDVSLDHDQEQRLCFVHQGTCEYWVLPGAAPLPSDAGDWSWRVQARLGSAWGPWSEAASFAVAPAREPVGAEVRLMGRLEGWTHGPGRLEGFWQPDWEPVGEGVLEADGAFTFRLPPLAFAEEVDDDPFFATEPIDQLVAWVLYVVQDESTVAAAALATSIEAANLAWTRPPDTKVGDALVTWWFAERPTTRSGGESAWGREDRFELDLREGWNTVLLRVVEVRDDGSLVARWSTVAEPPADVAWRWAYVGE
jgi:hypothetical protein